jgi:hypothetical protein
MIVHTEYQQGSLEWLIARAGVPTASEFDNLVTPEFKIRTGEMPQTYLATKLAEAWLQGPLPGAGGSGFGTFAMEQGNVLEDEAKPWYELEYSQTITRVGFCTTDDGRIGCSPDGLIGEDSGIEIKCPEPTAHVKYLLAGDLPKQYRAQVQGCMFVTGRPSWKFVSYRRGFPKLVLTIERNQEAQDTLQIVLDDFIASFSEQFAKIVERNGGLPPKRKPFVASPVEDDKPDIMP